MANAQTNKSRRRKWGGPDQGETAWFKAKRGQSRRLKKIQKASRKANRRK